MPGGSFWMAVPAGSAHLPRCRPPRGGHRLGLMTAGCAGSRQQRQQADRDREQSPGDHRHSLRLTDAIPWSSPGLLQAARRLTCAAAILKGDESGSRAAAGIPRVDGGDSGYLRGPVNRSITNPATKNFPQVTV